MWDKNTKASVNYMDSFSVSTQIKRFGQSYVDLENLFSAHPTNDFNYHLISMF